MRIEILRLSPWRRMTLAVFVLEFLAVCCGAPRTAGAKEKGGGSFAIPPWAFDRGNAKVSVNPDIYADYRDLHPELIAGDGGQTPGKLSTTSTFRPPPEM